MQIAFNTRAPKSTDPAITEMRAVNNKMTRTAVAGAYLVDSLPILNYLPTFLAPFKREADELFEETLRLFTSHVDKVRNDIKQGKDAHCFTKYILSSQKEYGLTDPEAVFVSTSSTILFAKD